MLTLQTEERTQVKGEPPARTGSCIRGWITDGFSCLIPILCRDEDNQILGCLGEGATRGQHAPGALLAAGTSTTTFHLGISQDPVSKEALLSLQIRKTICPSYSCGPSSCWKLASADRSLVTLPTIPTGRGSPRAVSGPGHGTVPVNVPQMKEYSASPNQSTQTFWMWLQEPYHHSIRAVSDHMLLEASPKSDGLCCSLLLTPSDGFGFKPLFQICTGSTVLAVTTEQGCCHPHCCE